MTRELTQFQQGLRSDLLLGRGDRWAVSTPQDELEKFRFFVRQIERLIDQAEESEISSLKESVTGLSSEAQDEFWQYNYPVHWDEIFRTTSRNSMIVSLATFLEIFLNRFCYQVSLVTRSDLTAQDLRGSMLERARKYLRTIGKFKKPNSTNWDQI